MVRVLAGDGAEIGDFVNGPWQLEKATDRQLAVSRTHGSLTLRKTVTLDGGRMDPALTLAVATRNAGDKTIEGAIEVESNFNLSGGGGNPAAYYRWEGGETRHDEPGSAPAGTALSFGNDYEEVDVEAAADPPANAAWYPVETVSNSEAGFERTYQGSCLTYRWPLRLAPGEDQSFEIRFRVTQSRDRLVEEERAGD